MNHFHNNNYLLFIIKSVSTIPDECKGVGCEIGTHPKRKAMEKSDKALCNV